MWGVLSVLCQEAPAGACFPPVLAAPAGKRVLCRLILAGTDLERYRNIRVEPTPEAKAQAYSMVGYDSFEYDFGQGSGAAVPLEEFDLGDYR